MSNINRTHPRASAGRGTSTAKSGNTTLTAVALQDQLMRNMGGLSLSNPLGSRRPPLNKPVRKKQVRSVVDTGRGQGKKPGLKSKEVEEKEYVLDAAPPPLTLAQKMGLVEAPTQLLDEQDWDNVKMKSNQREDSKEPCVICKEDFKFEAQVLLSCSHVFHRGCLEAFEKFSGKKTCPMCRKEQYQARVIHEGAKQHKQKCATLIQATWRGYVVRSWYLKLRETVPPKDPALRQKFYENKLHNITDRMVKSLDYDVNRFLSDIDQSLEASRDVFRHFDNTLRVITDDEWDQIQLKAVVRGETDCPICLTALEEQGLVSELARSKPQQPQAKPKSNKNSVASKRTGDKGKSSAQKTADARESQEKQASEKRRQRLLLSCSHVFHQTCLEAFEEFAIGEKKNVCPVCRSNYHKRVL